MTGYSLRPNKKVDRNILVVEDDDDTAETLGMTLLTAGYGVRVCKNRNEASNHIKRNIYHIILLDYFMEGKKAEVFIEEARQFSPISKIILITAAPRAPEVAKNLGLEYWICKPIDPNVLTEAIEEI